MTSQAWDSIGKSLYQQKVKKKNSSLSYCKIENTNKAPCGLTTRNEIEQSEDQVLKSLIPEDPLQGSGPYKWGKKEFWGDRYTI